MRSDNPQEVDFFQRFVDEGMEKGKAAAVVVVLRGRGLEVDAKARERIVSCTDTAQLEKWLLRAGTIHSVQELFEFESGPKAPTSERQSQRS